MITFLTLLRRVGGHVIYRSVALYAVVFSTVQIVALYEVAWFVAYIVTVNLVAFMVYFFDKLISPIKKVPLLKHIFNIRAPETFLFWELGLLGGGIGAVYGIHLNDHKTSDDFRWQRLQLWLINWVVFAGLVFLLWTAVLSFEEINELIGSIMLSVFDVGQWLINLFSLLFAGR